MKALFLALVGLGATPHPSVLLAASRAGHTEVVRELLDCRLGGLDLNRALLLALEHATDLQRARGLVGLLGGAGADASAVQRRGALVRNLHGGLAGMLLDALALRPSASERSELLQQALGARNCRLAHDLLDAGTIPLPRALAPACAAGDESLVRRLLDAGLSARNRDALEAAVRTRSSGVLRLLLDAVRWPPEDPDVLQALRDACRGGSVECAAELLRKGADPLAVNALPIAASNGCLGLVRLLRSTGRYADAHAQRPLNSALCEACRSGSVECAAELLGAGADPLGTGALSAAACKGFVPLVRLLLGTGRFAGEAELLSRALEEACRSGSAECAEELLAAGADPAASPALTLAADAGSAALLRMLLATGRFPPAAAGTGGPRPISSGVTGHYVDPKTPLERALAAAYRRRDNAGCVAELLDAGADPTRTDALWFTAAHGDVASVRLLLGTGRYAADHPQLTDALEGACWKGQVAAVQALLDAGADPVHGLRASSRLRENTDVLRVLLATGRCPPGHPELSAALEMACHRTPGDSESYIESVVRQLLSAGADPGAGLSGAAQAGRVELLRELLATGRCDRRSMDKALEMACWERNWDAAQTLRDAGANLLAVLAVFEVVASGLRGLLVQRLLAVIGHLAADEAPAGVKEGLNRALWIACERESVAIVGDLLAAGADPATALGCPTLHRNRVLRQTLQDAAGETLQDAAGGAAHAEQGAAAAPPPHG